MVHDVDWSNPPAWLAVIVGVTSVVWAERARKQSKRSADAAARSIELAELVEQRKRHGWALELRDGTEGLILRNTGTLDACDVELDSGPGLVRFIGENVSPSATDIIRAGQGKAILVVGAFASGGGIELTIEWRVESETDRRVWVEPVPS